MKRWSGEGRTVCVATPFAGGPRRLSPFAEELHRLWGFGDEDDVMRVRREEDRAALGRLGSSWRHGDLPDAVYRWGEGGPLYQDLRSLRSEVHPDDPSAAQLDSFLDELPRAARTLVPLAAGGHVDHRLVHSRASAWAARRGAEVWLYEDFPYAQHLANRLRALVAAKARRGHAEGLGAELLSSKIEAAEQYASQLVGDLAGDGLRAALEAFTRRRGGERYWRPRAGRST